MMKQRKLAITSWLMAFAIGTVLSACGGGGESSSADTILPTVSQASPTNNIVDVSVNSAISATFSETMDAATITTATFTLTANGGSAITGTVAYSGTTATFTPSVSLAYSTTYTATITTGAKDMAGNAVVNNYIWTFTTGAAPTLNTITVDIALSPILVGETTSAMATGHYSDGSSADLTNQANWSSSSSSATVSSVGTITGATASNAVAITATLGAVNGSSNVSVLTSFSLNTPTSVMYMALGGAVSQIAVGVPAGTYVLSMIGKNSTDATIPPGIGALENGTVVCPMLYVNDLRPQECRFSLAGDGHRVVVSGSTGAFTATGIATLMPVPGPGPYSAESNIALTAGTQRVSAAVATGASTYTVTGQTAYTIGIFGMTGDVNLSVTTGGAGTVTCTYVSLVGTEPEECRVSGAASNDIVDISVTAVGADAGYVLLAK